MLRYDGLKKSGINTRIIKAKRFMAGFWCHPYLQAESDTVPKKENRQTFRIIINNRAFSVKGKQAR